MTSGLYNLGKNNIQQLSYYTPRVHAGHNRVISYLQNVNFELKKMNCSTIHTHVSMESDQVIKSRFIFNDTDVIIIINTKTQM